MSSVFQRLLPVAAGVGLGLFVPPAARRNLYAEATADAAWKQYAADAAATLALFLVAKRAMPSLAIPILAGGAVSLTQRALVQQGVIGAGGQGALGIPMRARRLGIPYRSPNRTPTTYALPSTLGVPMRAY